jgi:ABC-type transport system involved in multi-copper enzyme maturation permease subunit
MVIPLLLPVMLGILLIVTYNVPFTATHWAKFFTFLGVTLLYFTCFIAAGLLVSSLTKSSAVSFLLLLVLWVTFVLIIPRVGVMMAGQIVKVPTVAEIEGLQDGYEKNRWAKHGDEMETRWRERNAQMAGMSAEEREAYQDEHLLEWTEQEDQARRAMQKDIIENSRKLNEDLRNRKAELERLAFTLSRFSPASSYQLAAMSLAGTGIEIKANYEDAMRNYRTAFVDYVEKKRKESGGVGGIRVTMDTETGFKLSTDRDQGTLDLNDLPRFVASQHSFAEALAPAAVDFGLLAFYTIAAFAGAFVAFLKYDVR